MSAYQLVAKHVEAALLEAETQSVSADVVARNLLSLAVDIFRREGRPLPDIAAELIATAENLDDDQPISFMRP
jgi:hypothetical protein